MIAARVYVRLKQSVLDPQGSAVGRSLHGLGFAEVRDVRVGRLIEVTIDTDDENVARERVEQMCEALLANPVIEAWEIHSLEAVGRDAAGGALTAGDVLAATAGAL